MVLHSLLLLWFTILSLASAFVIGRTDIANNETQGEALHSPSGTTPLSATETLDPKVVVVQSLGARPIQEVNTYMATLGAMAVMARERWTGSAPASSAWGYPTRGNDRVGVKYEFRNLIARRIVFTAFTKFFLGYANQERPFVESRNEVFYDGRSKGFLDVAPIAPLSSAMTNTSGSDASPVASTNITDDVLLADGQANFTDNVADNSILSIPTNDRIQLLIDTTRGTLSKAEFFSPIAAGLYSLAQMRAEELAQAYGFFPVPDEGEPDIDVSISFDVAPTMRTPSLTNGQLVLILYEIAKRAAENRDGGKFAQLYGRIKMDGVIYFDWKLQRGRPIFVGGNSTIVAVSNSTSSTPFDAHAAQSNVATS